MLKAVVAAGGHSLFTSIPCGNRKFTEPLPDGNIKAVFGAKYLRAEHFREDGKRQGGSLPIAVSAG